MAVGISAGIEDCHTGFFGMPGIFFSVCMVSSVAVGGTVGEMRSSKARGRVNDSTLGLFSAP